jgi:hypothetical protein
MARCRMGHSSQRCTFSIKKALLGTDEVKVLNFCVFSIFFSFY